MQALDDLIQTTVNISTGPSLALDFSWILTSSRKASPRINHPELSDLYDDTEVRDRVTGLWDDGYGCFAEIEVWSAHAGALFCVDPDELISKLDASIGSIDLDMALRTETPADRAAIVGRLRRLGEDRALRSRYFELLRTLYSRLGPRWQTQLPVARDTGDHVVQQIASGRPWREFLGGCSIAHSELDEIAYARTDPGHIYIVPCVFFGKGLVIEVADGLIIGIGLQPESVAVRARTESLARRLKVVADPTRLSIIQLLASGNRSVGELARAFQVAQPTISNHIKQLREAGLVQTQRHGSRLECSVDRNAAGTLAADLGALFD